MADENIKPLNGLYNRLAEKGANLPEDYETFEAAFTKQGKEGATNRHKLYDNVGYFGLLDGDDYSTWYTTYFQPISKTSSKAREAGTPMNNAERNKMLEKTSNMMSANEASAERAKRSMERTKANTGLKAKKVELGHNRNVAEINTGNWDEEKGAPETTYITETGNEYSDRGGADLEQNALDEARYQREQTEEYLKQQKALLTADLDKRAKEIDKEVDEQSGDNWFTSLLREGAAGGNPLKQRDAREGKYNMARQQDKQYAALQASLAQIDDALATIDEGKKGKASDEWIEDSDNVFSKNGKKLLAFGAGAGRGFLHAVGKASTWDMGARDLANNAATLSAINKAGDKGENIDNLSAEERDLLNLTAVGNKVQADNEKYIGRGYKAGEVTGESLPFMIEMYANPLSGTGKVAMKQAMKQMVKKYGKEKIRKMVAKYLAAKVGARVVGDALGAAGMAATTGGQRVLADAAQRMTGNIQYGVDDNGKVIYAGTENRKSTGDAMLEGFLATTIENHSEMLGEYFAPLLKGMGKLSAKGLRKVGLNRVNNFVNNVGSTDFSKMVSRFEGKAQWHGSIGEYAEEVLGNIENAILVGDQTFDTDKDTGIFNLDNNIDTFLGVGLMGGAISAAKTVSYRGEKRETANRMAKMGRQIDQLFAGNLRTQEWWGGIRNTLMVGDAEEKRKALREVVTNKELPFAARQAIVQFSGMCQKYEGIVRGMRSKRGEDTVNDKQNESYERGYAAEPKDMAGIKDAYEQAQEKLCKAFDMPKEALETLNIEGVERTAREGENEETRQAAIEYLSARATYRGMMEHVHDEIMDSQDYHDSLIDMRTDETGNIQQITLKEKDENVNDRKMYLTRGKVVMSDDGKAVNTRESDQSLIVCDESGNTQMISPKDIFRVDAPVSAEEEKKAVRESIKQERGKYYADVIDGVTDADGNPITREENTETEGEAAPVAMPQAGETVEVTNEDGSKANLTVQAVNADGYEVTDGNRVWVMPAEEMQKAIAPKAETEQSEEAESKPALERVPVNEKTGEPMFEKVDEATALDALNEMTNGNEETTTTIVNAQVAQAQKALDDLKKKKPTKKSPKLNGSPMQMLQAQQKVEEQFNAAMEQYNAQVVQVEETLNAWERIHSLMEERERDQRSHDAAVAQLEEDKRIAAEKATAQTADGTEGNGNGTVNTADGNTENVGNGRQDGTDETNTDKVTPIGESDFGFVYDQFKGNVQGAIRQLMKMQDGEALGALHHDEIGDIDLVWGKVGTRKSDGYGLAKLVKFHPEVLDNLQGILDSMHVTKRSENRVQLENDEYQAAVRLTWNGEEKLWLLTAFKKKETPEPTNSRTDVDSNLDGKSDDTTTRQSSDVSADKATNNQSTLQENEEKSSEKQQGGESHMGSRTDKRMAEIGEHYEGRGESSNNDGVKVRIDAIKNLKPVTIEVGSTKKEDVREDYNALGTATNKTDGKTVLFYHSVFGKMWRGENSMFAKVAAHLNTLFENSLYGFSSQDNMTGKTRQDGTIHKEHRNIENYDYYIAKAKVDEKDFYVRFTIQNERKGQSGVYDVMCTNVEIYENPIGDASTSTIRGERLDSNEVSDTKLMDLFRTASKNVEENAEVDDIRYRTSEGLNEEFGDRWLNEQTNEDRKATEEAMVQRVNELSERLGTPVRIIQSEEEVAQLPNSRQRRMKGSYNTRTGEVTIVVPNNVSVEDVENTFVHEVVGHSGLRLLFPEEATLNNALDELYRVSESGIRQAIDQEAQKMYDTEIKRIMERKRMEHEAKGENPNATRYTDMAEAHVEASKKREQYKRIATEEYAADLAGRIGEEGFERMSKEEQTFWGRLKAMLQSALNNLLQGLGINSEREWSDKEWAYVMHEAYKRKKNGGNPSMFDIADTEAMREKTGFGESTDSEREELNKVNERFNEELQMQIDGKLPAGHIYEMGKPGAVLLSTGVPNLPIQMNAQRLQNKATLFDHDFNLSEVIDLVKALQHPLAVFAYGDKTKAQNIIVPLQKDGKNFIVGLSLNPTVNGRKLEINSVRNVFPKDNAEWLNWINQGKALYIDKGKIQNLIDQQRTNLADVDYLDLDSAAKVVNDFVNPKVLDEKNEDTDILFRDGDSHDYERAMARDEYERKMRGGWFQTVEALQDSMLSLKEAMQGILKAEGKGKVYIEDVAGFENAYLGENRLSSVNLAEEKYAKRTYFDPLMRTVARMAKTADERAEMTDYLMAKHGLERNEVMARRAAEKKAREEFKDELRKAERAVAKDPLDQDAKDKLDDVKQRMTDREQDLYVENRGRDYAGLTALTQTDNVADAEAEARKMVSDYEGNRDIAEIDTLWDWIEDVNGYTLKRTYESGIISEDTYNDIKNMYQYYIPLRGFDETTSDEVYAYTRQSGNAFSSPIKTAKGRKSKADDPFANMEAMMESAIVQGNKNTLVKQKFLNFVMNHPSDLFSVSDVWLRYDSMADEWKTVQSGDVAGTEKINDTDSPAEVERKMRDFEAAMEQLVKNDPKNYAKQSDNPDIPYRVVHKSEENEHQVVVMRGGKKKVITVNGNPRAAQALNGQTNPDNKTGGSLNKVFDKGQDINRKLSAVYTSLNPDFVVSNYVRDMLYANTTAHIKEGAEYGFIFNGYCATLSNPAVLAGLYYELKSGRLDGRYEMGTLTGIEKDFYEFIKNGGETGFTAMKNIEKRKEDLERQIKKYGGKLPAGVAWDALKDSLDFINESIENSARFAAYLTSRKMGRTIDRSIWDAKEISVNFNKKGAADRFMDANGQTRMGKAAAFIGGAGRGMYVFWNAAIQGTANAGKIVGRHKVKSLTMMAALFGLGALTAALGAGGGDDDGDYYDLPEYTRRSNILFRFPGMKQWISIPLPVEYRAIYGLGELASSTATGNGATTEGDLAKAIAEQTSQLLPIDFMEGNGGWHAVIPSWAKPAAEAAANESWTGLPVYKDSEYNKTMPEWTKAYKSANKYIVWATKELNEATGGDDYKKGTIDLNPAKIEYMLSGYMGGLFSFLDRTVKTVETMAGAREYDAKNIPFVNRVVKQGDERTKDKAINNRYYNMQDEAEETDKLLKGYTEASHNYEDGERTKYYREKLQELKTSPEYRRYRLFSRENKKIKELQDKRKDARSDEQRENIDERLAIRKRILVGRMAELRKAE